ncbi:MAG: hypothetical protein RIC56_18225 [Pseudomonadales bacterium]
MNRPTALIRSALALSLMLLATTTAAAELTGRWLLNQELTTAEQPDGPTVRKGLFSRMPQTTVSVGGIPLPGSGGSGLPSVAGNPQDPKVLRAAEFSIEPQGETLHLSYVGVGSETLKRGNDQGLISRWDRRRLSTRYETTSRKVSQEFTLRKDGRLLVTVKLDPNQGATTVHKRVFDPADSTSAQPR